MTDVSLLVFGYTHFEVDRVAYDIHLCRVEAIEQITIVPIVVAHGILILRESFVQLLLVIYVTGLHTKQSVEVVTRDDGVAHPCDIADIVFLSFVDLDIEVDMVLINVPHTILQNSHVAKAQLVILVDKVLFGGLVSLIGEFL